MSHPLEEKYVDSSTTVISTLCKGISKNKSTYSTRKLPLATIKKEEHDLLGLRFICPLRTKAKKQYRYDRRETSSDARKYIGIFVTKIFSGERYTGKVEHYDVETGWYKIVYNDGDSEDVNKDELLALIPPPRLISFYLKQREARKKDIARKRPALMARASNSLTIHLPKKKGEPKLKKGRTPSTYVPLAFRDNKKDVYYWY